MVKIRILAFATAAHALGSAELETELPSGSTVADLQAELKRRSPQLRPLLPRWAVAVNGIVATGKQRLEEGDEIALLPPVSGGSDDFSSVLVDGPLDSAAVASRVVDPACGAVLIFQGDVRSHYRRREVRKIVYEAYRPMAELALARIQSELAAGDPGLRIAISHRLGEVPVGETSVVIAVSSPHRQAAYEASRTALERLKREVPIWKQEYYADGEVVWREGESLLATSAGPSD